MGLTRDPPITENAERKTCKWSLNCTANDYVDVIGRTDDEERAEAEGHLSANDGDIAIGRTDEAEPQLCSSCQNPVYLTNKHCLDCLLEAGSLEMHQCEDCDQALPCLPAPCYRNHTCVSCSLRFIYGKESAAAIELAAKVAVRANGNKQEKTAVMAEFEEE